MVQHDDLCEVQPRRSIHCLLLSISSNRLDFIALGVVAARGLPCAVFSRAQSHATHQGLVRSRGRRAAYNVLPPYVDGAAGRMATGLPFATLGLAAPLASLSYGTGVNCDGFGHIITPLDPLPPPPGPRLLEIEDEEEEDDAVKCESTSPSSQRSSSQ